MHAISLCTCICVCDYFHVGVRLWMWLFGCICMFVCGTLHALLILWYSVTLSEHSLVLVGYCDYIWCYLFHLACLYRITAALSMEFKQHHQLYIFVTFKGKQLRTNDSRGLCRLPHIRLATENGVSHTPGKYNCISSLISPVWLSSFTNEDAPSTLCGNQFY